MGADIDAGTDLQFFGKSVSLSADGSRLAVGATPTNTSAGYVRLYDWNGSAWVQVGAQIDGEANGDECGSSVTLSADASRVAIGAPGNDGNGANAGHVRLFDWNGSAWVQVGADIDGGAAVENILLGATAIGVGVCFFGQFDHEPAVSAYFRIPAGRRSIGTIAVGEPDVTSSRQSQSAQRPARSVEDRTHWGRW